MTMHALVQELVELAESLESDYESCSIDEKGAEQLAILLASIRECRAGLATFASVVEKDLLSEMGSKAITVEGLGLVEAKKATKRTAWENEALTARVVALALDERRLDESSGEYESEGSAVARVLSECARPSWRVTALRAHGLDPDEWCHVEEGAWSVRLPGRDAL